MHCAGKVLAYVVRWRMLCAAQACFKWATKNAVSFRYQQMKKGRVEKSPLKLGLLQFSINGIAL
jgi:hypothetical protein